MAPASDDFVVDFPTLGFLIADWQEQHCSVPTGFQKGQPFVQPDWQLWCTVNHYRVKPTARWVPERPVLAPAFHNRRSLIVGPQKIGKGPWSAATACNEAAGPALFAGWARGGEVYDCRQHDCGCGWIYEYEPGEPMGMPWPTPLIQLFATSQEQVDNVYAPLQTMIKDGPLGEFMRVGEEFIRVRGEGKIEAVTSSALSRLGNPITAAFLDETGTYTAQNKLKGVAKTARRGLAGMGGRAIETTNLWDPSQASTAQETFHSRAADIFRYLRQPPAHLKFKDPQQRRKILEHVYAGTPWVDLDAVEAEAFELLEKDPEEAERFFGNIFSQGKGKWMPEDLWTNSESVAK